MIHWFCFVFAAQHRAIMFSACVAEHFIRIVLVPSADLICSCSLRGSAFFETGHSGEEKSSFHLYDDDISAAAPWLIQWPSGVLLSVRPSKRRLQANQRNLVTSATLSRCRRLVNSRLKAFSAVATRSSSGRSIHFSRLNGMGRR